MVTITKYNKNESYDNINTSIAEIKAVRTVLDFKRSVFQICITATTLAN